MNEIASALAITLMSSNDMLPTFGFGNETMTDAKQGPRVVVAFACEVYLHFEIAVFLTPIECLFYTDLDFGCHFLLPPWLGLYLGGSCAALLRRVVCLPLTPCPLLIHGKTPFAEYVQAVRIGGSEETFDLQPAVKLLDDTFKRTKSACACNYTPPILSSDDLGRAGHHPVIHLSNAWGGLRTRISFLDRIISYVFPTSPKLENECAP